MDKIFPEFQGIFSDMFGKTSCAILKKCPSSKEVLEIDFDEFAAIIKKSSRSKFNIAKAKEIKLAARDSFSALIDPAPLSFLVKQMVEQIELLENQIQNLEHEISEIKHQHIPKAKGISEYLDRLSKELKDGKPWMQI